MISADLLSARDRRTLLVGVASCAGLLGLARGVPAWRASVADARAAAEEQATHAARAEALIAALPALRDSLTARRARLAALTPALVAGASRNAAGATLASLLTAAATDADVTLGPVQLRLADGSPSDSTRGKPRARSTFTRIRAESDVTGDVRGLSQFLLALEQGPTRLIVRSVSVTQSDVVGAPDRAEVLHATVAVEGLARLDPAPPAPRVAP